MGKTSIEWTQGDDGELGKTWNPVRGCSPVSPGCKNCYAELIAARFSGPGQPFEGFAKWRLKSGHAPPFAVEQHDIPNTNLPLFAPGEREPAWTGKIELLPKKLPEPLRWRKTSRVFVDSMSDLFHEGLTFEEIATVWSVMAAATQHTFLVLTKRIERALAFLKWLEAVDPNARMGDLYGLHVSHMRSPEVMYDDDDCPADYELAAIFDADWPLPNVWLGASVENQRFADERVPVLLRCAAAKRFISYEPALGPVDFRPFLPPSGPCVPGRPGQGLIDQIIVGGEAGPDARPFDVAWIPPVIAACR
jgi:protein gp37